MAYNKDFPVDDSYLADFPSGEREQIRAIVEDKIVNAGKLQGLAPSNASGQVPVSNGSVCNNLNADKLDGYDASHFSEDGHVHNNASTSTAGFMSAADKTKLDGVATGAEVNQNAFGNVAVGTSTLQADNKQDTLYIAAGSNVSIAADETNDKITIGLTGIVPVANGGTGVSSLANITVGNATADASGNNIANTYAKKTEVDNKISTAHNYIKRNTAYKVGDILESPNLSHGYLIVVTQAGTTGSSEPDWPTTEGSTVADGTVQWTMRDIRHAQSADTATKATGDSDGNNIKDTYAPQANTYTKTEVDTIKDNIISNPLVGNDVLWDYLHRLGENPTLPTTNADLNALGMFMSYFTQNKIANQPGQYGQLLNIPADKGVEGMQLWIEQAGGRMYHRGGNNSIAINDTPFTRFLDTNDLSAAGVVAGNVSNASAWWVKLGGAIPLIIQGGYKYVNERTDVYVHFPIAYSTVLSIVGTPVVNAENSSGRGLENIKTYNTTSFVYYSGYDINYKNLLWLSVGI